MKTSKRILIFILSIFLMGSVAGILSIPAIFFHYSFWLSFLFFFGIQPIGKVIYDNYVEVSLIADMKQQLLDKPYKEDIIGLNCQACGTVHQVPYNLDTENFRCLKCKRLNTIHHTFQTTIANELIP